MPVPVPVVLPRPIEARLVARTGVGSVLGSARVTRFGPARSWRGVPYAAPPLGEQRFAAPTPHRGWDGVRSAAVRGPQSPQPMPLLPAQISSVFGSRGSNSEDCLTLDVHIPGDGEGETTSPEKAPPGGDVGHITPGGPARPVLVWIHGGAFETGTAGAFDGAELAARGGIVVVCINYRLGMIGFGNVHDVVAERAGVGVPAAQVASNLGLRDQIHALEWVRDNIAHFGGDPDRVTIAGESAGACSVSVLMKIPRARGLFHQAIAQSGAVNMVTDREDASRLAREFCSQLGASREDPAGLWSAPIGEVLRAQALVAASRPSALTCRPWLDGDLLPATFDELLDAPSHVPFLSGHNRDEHTLFRSLARGQFPATRAAIAIALDAVIGPAAAAEVLAHYPDDDEGLNTLGTDLAFAMPAIQHCERHLVEGPVYRYRLDFASPAFGLGAFHGLDVLLLFPQHVLTRLIVLGRDTDRAGAGLIERMQQHWVHFVAHGRPDPELAPDWSPYDLETRTTWIFDREDRAAEDPEGERRAYWGERELLIY